MMTEGADLRGKVDVGRCALCGARGRVIVAYYGPKLCPQCCADEAARMDAEEAWPKAITDWPTVSGLAVVAVAGGTLGAFYSSAPGDALPYFYKARPGADGARPFPYTFSISAPVEWWIHDSAIEALGWPRELPGRATIGPKREEGDGPEGRGRVPWWREGGEVFVVPRWYGMTIPRGPRAGEYVNDSPWWGFEPMPLYSELCAFVGALGARWVRSAAVTSDELIWAHWKGRIEPAEIPDESPEGLDGLADTRLEMALVSAIIPGPATMPAGRFCYGFDLNANYLGAASNLPLPTGSPKPCGLIPSIGEKGAPGYWTQDQARWVTSPTAAGGRGPWQGWIYPESHQYLQPWYKQLRDARAALVPGAALSAVKAIYRAGWGRLESTRRGDGDLARRLYQPYWGQAVQANARERLRRRIAELRTIPVAIDTDAIFVMSDRHDARIAALELGLTLGDGLGQWKASGRVDAREARKILATEDEIEAVTRLRARVKEGTE